MTKQFTAAAILTLRQTGRLALDDKLGALLPGTPAYARDVTVRQLLTHTSGVPDYEPLLGNGKGPQIHDRDVLDLLRRAKALHVAAGTSWRYSNSGYALLALIVERVSGESFPAYLRRHLELLREEAKAESVVEPPLTDLERAQERALARRAIDALGERDREALLMREEGLDYNEIAEALELSVASVGTTLSRARRRLVEVYEELRSAQDAGRRSG